MLQAAMTALSTVVRQMRFGNPEAEITTAVETPREIEEPPESLDPRGCETLRSSFGAMGMHHLNE